MLFGSNRWTIRASELGDFLNMMYQINTKGIVGIKGQKGNKHFFLPLL